MGLEDWISSGIALLALIVSGGSYRLAQKSLSLSEAELKKKEPEFSLYLADNFYQDVDDNRLFVFSLTISNPADAANTITVCELKIIYEREDKTLGNLLLQHDKSLVADLGSNPFLPIELPCLIQAHGASVGIAIFKLNSELVRELVPERYELIFRDAHDLESRKDIFIIRDVGNE